MIIVYSFAKSVTIKSAFIFYMRFGNDLMKFREKARANVSMSLILFVIASFHHIMPVPVMSVVYMTSQQLKRDFFYRLA